MHHQHKSPPHQPEAITSESRERIARLVTKARERSKGVVALGPEGLLFTITNQNITLTVSGKVGFLKLIDNCSVPYKHACAINTNFRPVNPRQSILIAWRKACLVTKAGERSKGLVTLGPEGGRLLLHRRHLPSRHLHLREIAEQKCGAVPSRAHI